MAVTSNTVSNTYAALEVPPSNPPAPPAEPKTPPLEDEVALVHQAHSALASGDTPRALAILDRHDLDYIHGALAPEALEVRIEAYVQRHDETKVAELAQAFLSRYPGHPLTGKVRSLLGKGPLR
jgi:outer membrane protein assembly factor BamD (BamD/ComL family)